MKSGTDVGGLWHTIESGTTYVPTPLCYFASHPFLNSIAGYISHVPWTFPILMSIPGADKKMRKMQALGKRCAEQRVEAGSATKDLFYYLVRTNIRIDCCRVIECSIDRRRNTEVVQGSFRCRRWSSRCVYTTDFPGQI